MRLRMLKGILFLAIASVASVLFFMMSNERVREGAYPEMTSARTANAEGILMMALKKNPGHAPVSSKLAEGGHLQPSAECLPKLLEAGMNNSEANLELGRVLISLCDVSGALEHSVRILKTNPNYEEALYNMGAGQANIGRRNDATNYWSRLASGKSNSELAPNTRKMMKRLTSGNS